MKRILALLLAMMMIAGMTVSCTGSEEEEEEDEFGFPSAMPSVAAATPAASGFSGTVLNRNASLDDLKSDY